MFPNPGSRPDEPGACAPVIGITTYLQRAQTGVWDVPASFLPKTYLDGVTDAGGIAVLLPPQPTTPACAARVLSRLDGLIIAGGVDVDPARYGQAAHEKTDAPQTMRDTWDLALLDAAIATEVPFLAICRGAQVLNVLRGGTLHQHLPDVVGSPRYQLGGGAFNRVEVEITPGSTIARLVGEHSVGSMYHHQAIDEVGDGLVVTARSDDGVVEAVELPSVPFGVAVQWHPEEETDDRRLFAGLVEAAKAYATERMKQDA
ncbi:gamma-glutamyl-gamma-aminobutyrate hydrolase family protein [Gryllotalpicola protaetiae]|uniref:Gamma-glutamyl-gamma-aminobutyrate hydrolase family protein n=1 Tax=Gryllotalpicola protaetiae TaxID=2419771 RepID=A0A387BNG2_9MICO|nr:gamma-glutamyl-gamma-aminobutyrate hydrolase family protein [Gryllotalpicola protaetiae]AYG05363.1 gamma-glutamyl-gamma-aminobutyrate hydrolase family protein [Gryllotalpicola protaetiae]